MTGSPQQVNPAVVRYIKLGRGGGWERECLEHGIARFGYGTERASRFSAALEARWAEITQAFLAEGKSQGTATRFTNDARRFFEDRGDTLWITFSGQQLWWAFFDPSSPEQHPDGRGTFRKVVGAWHSTDLAGERLTTDRLAPSLTKVAGYRGTICALRGATAAYAVGRINGVRSPQIERALTATNAMKASARELIGLLEPRDLELLVDLVFTSSGWRRLGSNQQERAGASGPFIGLPGIAPTLDGVGPTSAHGPSNNRTGRCPSPPRLSVASQFLRRTRERA